MEAVAKHDFRATADDELGFKRGNLIKITCMEKDPNWYDAVCEGKTGVVPKNYIEMRPHHWYVGRCSRIEAEQWLLERDEVSNTHIQPDGAFLVRPSETCPGDFSLSVKYNDAVQHFKVLTDENGRYFLWVYKFDSLNQLIDYHRTTTISKTNVITLKDMVGRRKGERLVRALYDFTGETSEELSFRKGELLRVVDQEDENWLIGDLLTQSNPRRLLFPANYVENHRHPYLQHQGDMNNSSFT